MKKTLTTLATVATLSFGLSAPVADAMEMELNMLTGSIYNSLRSMGLPTDNIDNLTLAQIGQIKSLIEAEDGMGKIQNIKKILDEAK